VTKREYMWIGGEDGRYLPPCVRDVRAPPPPPPPPPHARPPPCTDPTLTRATTVRQSVRPVFVFLRHIEPHH